jgi:hypothetical protein
MGRPPDPTNLRIAQFSGRTSRVRGVIWLAEPEVVARQRAELPALWEALDDLIELVDWD